MHRLRAFFLCILLLVGPPLLAAGEPLRIFASTSKVALAAHVEILEDPNGQLGIDQVRQPEHATRFRSPQASGDLNLGYSASAWWLRVTLQPTADTPPDWLLEVGFPTLDDVAFFAPGNTAAVLSGDSARFQQRPFRHRHFVFPVELAAGQTQTIHLRVSSAGSLTVPLTLWQPQALHASDQDAYAAHALYYGMLLALGLYNLLLWFSLRDRSYLAYVAFVAAMAIGQLAQGGFGYQYLWPDWPAWESMAFSSGYAATGFFGALFTRIFLDTARHHQQLDRVIVALAAGFAFAALAPLFLPYRQSAIATSLLGVSFSAVAVFSAFAALRRGHAGARFFLAAWSLLLAGVAIMGLRNMALLPTNFFTANGIQIGSVLEMLLLSFALADRIHLLRKEKEAAQSQALKAERERNEILASNERELEGRVEARTHELAEANERLRKSEIRLQDMAHHDPLTGLANRTLLFDRIGHAQQRATRSGNGFAILLIDLDGFKTVNDTLGHDAGDQILRMVANRLQQGIRAADTVARIGGDEFVVLIEDAEDIEAITLLAEKLVSALSQKTTIGEGEAAVGASIGVALWPQHGDTAQALLRNADRAMYMAKRSGHCRVVLASQD
jgi:diguanylate cyclase (GGDEF)-like protein